jgi:hypothetical protein
MAVRVLSFPGRTVQEGRMRGTAPAGAFESRVNRPTGRAYLVRNLRQGTSYTLSFALCSSLAPSRLSCICTALLNAPLGHNDSQRAAA